MNFSLNVLFYSLNGCHYITLADYYHIGCVNKESFQTIFQNLSLWKKIIINGIYSSTIWWNKALCLAHKCGLNGNFPKIAQCSYGERQYTDDVLLNAHNPVRYEFSQAQQQRIFQQVSPYSVQDILQFYLKPIVLEFVHLQAVIDVWFYHYHQDTEKRHQKLQEMLDLRADIDNQLQLTHQLATSELYLQGKPFNKSTHKYSVSEIKEFCQEHNYTDCKDLPIIMAKRNFLINHCSQLTSILHQFKSDLHRECGGLRQWNTDIIEINYQKSKTELNYVTALLQTPFYNGSLLIDNHYSRLCKGSFFFQDLLFPDNPRIRLEHLYFRPDSTTSHPIYEIIYINFIELLQNHLRLQTI